MTLSEKLYENTVRKEEITCFHHFHPFWNNKDSSKLKESADNNSNLMNINGG